MRVSLPVVCPDMNLLQRKRWGEGREEKDGKRAQFLFHGGGYSSKTMGRGSHVNRERDERHCAFLDRIITKEIFEEGGSVDRGGCLREDRGSRESSSSVFLGRVGGSSLWDFIYGTWSNMHV